MDFKPKLIVLIALSIYLVFGVSGVFGIAGTFDDANLGLDSSENTSISVGIDGDDESSSDGFLDEGISVEIGNGKVDNFLENVMGGYSGDIPLIVHVESFERDERDQLLGIVSEIKYEYELISAMALSVDVSRIEDLADLEFVNKIEYDAPVSSVMAHSTVHIGVRDVWAFYDSFGEGIVIAILDTGIDRNHPDFDNIIDEQDFTGEGKHDYNGHGTHVASIAAGSGQLSGGANRGVAPRASLMNVKVLDRFGSGRMSDTIAGIQYSVFEDADIISLSLGAEIPCNGFDAVSLASDAAVSQGVHVVAAAGNSGPLPASITSPGCAREVVTVGASDRFDNIALFSSRGPTLDGRTKPDLVAPGVLILAAQSGGSYTTKSGTSMSTPMVAGVIALILEENSDLSPRQVKDVLINTAVDLGEDRNSQGSGRIDAEKAFVNATGVDPADEEEGKNKAVRKSMDDEGMDEVDRVDERERGGNSYYVVEGSRYTDEGRERIAVWVNSDTGDVDFVESIGFIRSLWLNIIEFFKNIFMI